MSEKAPRSYAYSITWWDHEPILFNPDTMKYLLYAPEICPETRKPHWQTYLVWRFQKTLGASLKNLNFKTHPSLHICKGSYESNLNYIKGPYDKDGKSKPFNPDWKEFGQVPSKGARTDLLEIKAAIMNDDLTVDEILLTKPDIYHQYGRTLFALEDAHLRSKHRTWMTKCTWYWGGTGAGKSHAAFEDYSEKTHYLWSHDTSNDWWDGYHGQPIVVMNDYRGELKYNKLLQLVDKWPMKVSRRGREPTQFLGTHIIITSSLHPRDVYNRRADEDSLAQLYRRCKVVKLESKTENTAVKFLDENGDTDDEYVEEAF